MKIATLTMNPAIDKSTSIEHVAAERKLRCDAPRYDPGGGGLNVSRAIRSMGGRSLALYPAGGPPADILSHLLEKEELELNPISIAGWTRENLIVLETASNQQYRFGMPGPRLEEKEWQTCLDTVTGLDPKPDYIVASGSLPPGVPDDFYARLAAAAGKKSIRLVLDTCREPLRLALEEGVFLIKPNLGELEEITGEKYESEQQQKELATSLISRGKSEVVVVSLGAGGAVLADKNGTKRFRSPTVPIKSKVGAGDCMVAGMVLGLSRGMESAEAVRYGVAAGTAAVMTPGTELCRGEDVERLFKDMKQQGA